MTTTLWTINGLFGLIGEIFDELFHDEEALLVCVGVESRCAIRSMRLFALTNAKLRR